MPGDLVITHGLPGSGKTTAALKLKESLEKSGREVVHVERDQIREELFGFEYHAKPNKEGEEDVSKVQAQRIKEGLQSGKVVISSDTYLNPAWVKDAVRTAKQNGAEMHQVYVEVPIDVAKERNRLRGEAGGRVVPEFVIDDMAKRSYDHEGKMKEILVGEDGNVSFVSKNTRGGQKVAAYNKTLSRKFPFKGNSVAILDLDGTLANNEADAKRFLTGRKRNYPAFYASIQEAPVNRNVVELVRNLKAEGVNIVVVSGRSDSHAKEAISFVERSGVPVSEVYLKREGDFRKSFEFKKEVGEKLASRGFAVVHAIDDRRQDINMFRNHFGIEVSVVQPSESPKVSPEVVSPFGSGRCIRCGSPLKDPNKTIGDVCKKKVGKHVKD